MKNSILKLIIVGSLVIAFSGCTAQNMNTNTPLKKVDIFDNNNWTPVNHKSTNLNKVVN